jgi:hypothetical protein
MFYVKFFAFSHFAMPWPIYGYTVILVFALRDGGNHKQHKLATSWSLLWWLKFLLSVQELPASNLGPQTDYSD